MTRGTDSDPRRAEDGAPDGELIAGIARGDAAMLGRFYDRYAPVTMALVLRIVGSRARAEELLQEVFLQVWRRAADYTEERGSVAAWLFTIARHRALDLVRSVEHRRVDVMAEAPAALDSAREPPAQPDDVAAAGERGRAVRAAIDRLTPLQRQAIELAYYHGLSHSEIAARLGEPLGTIKSRIGQAMARLRAALAIHGDEAGP